MLSRGASIPNRPNINSVVLIAATEIFVKNRFVMIFVERLRV